MVNDVFPDAPESGLPAWKPLLYFGLYRGVLTGLFVVLIIWDAAPRPLGEAEPTLFRWTAVAYFFFALGCGVSILWRWPRFEAQVVFQGIVDLVALNLLTYASGGVNSGFGMLILVAVAGASILSRARVAWLFGAIATLGMLVQQQYGWQSGSFLAPHHAHAAMLGVAFFITAGLASLSARRIRASEALARMREVDLANLAQLNEHIIRRMQSGIVAVDSAGHIRLMNRSAQRLLGVPPHASGERLNMVLRELAQLMQLWRENMSQASHLFQPEGVQIKIMASFAAIGERASDGVLIFLEDASVMTQRAQQLKLASLGHLAASIAHEIRNPLGAVSHAGQLLQESPHLDSSEQRLLQIVRDNAARMNDIIENVLQVSRGRPAAPESLMLADWLEDFARDFVENQGLVAEALSVLVEPQSLCVRFDSSQFRQVLSNLCENGARHGRAAAGEARLQLRVEIDEETRRPFLDVLDNGEGIPEDLVEQIFEPFYTTHSNGTGLGLYIARELCEGNQAALNLMPTKHGGCFRITFSHPRRQDALPT